jgi:hypothetical protein
MDTESIITVLVFVAAFFGPIYFVTLRMSKPEKMLKPLNEEELDRLKKRLQEYEPWLAAVNLEFLTAFRFGVSTALVYQQSNVPRYFTFHFHGLQLTFDAQSQFQDGNCLETSTSGSSGMHLAPKSFKQSFPGIPPHEAWGRHLEGEEHLIKTRGFVLTPLSKPFKEALLEEIRETIRFTRSQPFWILRQYYRFFVTRYRIRNRTIAEQYPSTVRG